MGAEGNDQQTRHQTIKNSTSAVLLSHPLPVKGVSEESVLLFYVQMAGTLITERYTIIIAYKCQVIHDAAEQILHRRSTAVPLVQTICNDLQFVETWIYLYTTKWENKKW